MNSADTSFITSSLCLSELLKIWREKPQRPDFQQVWTWNEEGSAAGAGEA